MALAPRKSDTFFIHQHSFVHTRGPLIVLCGWWASQQRGAGLDHWPDNYQQWVAATWTDLESLPKSWYVVQLPLDITTHLSVLENPQGAVVWSSTKTSMWTTSNNHIFGLGQYSGWRCAPRTAHVWHNCALCFSCSGFFFVCVCVHVCVTLIQCCTIKTVYIQYMYIKKSQPVHFYSTPQVARWHYFTSDILTILVR